VFVFREYIGNTSVILTVKCIYIYIYILELMQQIRKITYVNGVVNRHVITNYMHIGHPRYTTTVLDINNQYAHDFYQSYIL